MKLEKKIIHYIPDANIMNKTIPTLQKCTLSRAQEGAKEKGSSSTVGCQGEKIRVSQTWKTTSR